MYDAILSPLFPLLTELWLNWQVLCSLDGGESYHRGPPCQSALSFPLPITPHHAVTRRFHHHSTPPDLPRTAMLAAGGFVFTTCLRMWMEPHYTLHFGKHLTLLTDRLTNHLVTFNKKRNLFLLQYVVNSSPHAAFNLAVDGAITHLFNRSK